MSRAPESAQAFNELIAALEDARDRYVESEVRSPDELDVVESYRYVTEVLSAVSELYIESDPERPRFANIVTPVRKMWGDNPDAIYFFARVRGDRSYRVSGNRGEACYVSFTVHGVDPSGGFNGPVLADVNDRDFTVAADGTYEIVFGPEPPEGDAHNFVRLDPGAHTIIVRNYFRQARSAQTDPDISVRIWIESLDVPGPASALTDATLAARIREGVGFLRASTVGQTMPGEAAPVPFVSSVPNTVGTPWSFRRSEIDAAGAVDIFYSSGQWDLGPDEALEMRGVIPDCVFANVMLWNARMQTLDYSTRRSSFNQEQIRYERDGSYRLVIAHSDPGAPNWLDTGGHRHGTIFWRFLLPEADPMTPECTVLPLAKLS